MWMMCRILLTAIIVASLIGCASVSPRKVVPQGFVNEAQVPGIPNARFWGDDVSPKLEERMKKMTRAEIHEELPALVGQPHNYLAVSGGGAEGAFGAGLLVGWSRAGNRPEIQQFQNLQTNPFSTIRQRKYRQHHLR